MKNIRMLALDFDLTLVDYPPGGGYEVDPAAVKTFSRIIENGGQAGIVSGRDVWPMRDILTIAGLIWGRPFPSYYIRRENYLHYQKDGVWVEDRAWNQTVRERTTRFCMENAADVPVWLKLAADRGFSAYNWVLFADFGLEAHFHSEEEAMGAHRVLREALAGRSELALHRNRMMVNIVPAGTGKGAALAHAAACFGFLPEQVLAFGDSDNDLSMLDGRYGFRSGTVSNSAPSIQRSVTDNGGYVADERASRGILQVLEYYQRDGILE